jgi:hypothetical protein
LDCLIEIRAPFDPDSATTRVADVLKSYGCHSTVGDHYSAEWIVSAFKKCGITYRHSDRDRSAIYSDALPLFTTGRAKLLDNRRLVTQLASLERKTSSQGNDKIDHSPGGHDDAANVCSGALVAATANKEQVIPIVAPIITGRSAERSPIPGQTASEAYCSWIAGGGGANDWGPI